MIDFGNPVLDRHKRCRRFGLVAGCAVSLVVGGPSFAQESKEAVPTAETKTSDSSQPPSSPPPAATEGGQPAQTSANPGSAPPAQTPSNPDKVPPAAPGPRRVHRAQMRLSGSTCMSCLVTLERKLKSLPGVEKVKIERADPVHFDYQGAPGVNYSEATITYDVGQVALSDIVAFMKTQGYHAYKIVDKEKG